MRGQKEERRLAQAYARATARLDGRQWGIVFAVALVVISVCGHVATVWDWLDSWMPEDLQPFLVVVPLVVLFTVGVFNAIWCYADVIIIRKAIRRLRYGDWDFFSFVVLDRPLRSKLVLQEPGVLFLFGHLLRRVGSLDQGNELIKYAVEQKDVLNAIGLDKKPSLSATEEATILAGLEGISRHSLVLRLWDNRRVRYSILAVCIVLVLLFYAMKVSTAG